MTSLSVLTLARGRTSHLLNLIEGIRRSELAPSELVVVDMNDEAISVDPLDCPIRLVRLPGEALPLAAARNLAARLSTSDRLLFLDADCIPSSTLIGVMDRAIKQRDGLFCPEVLYLGPNDARASWTEADLLDAGRAHPVRPFPRSGWRDEANVGLFWSLAFGVRKTTFEMLGGFDEAYVGYGAEDTDFGFLSRGRGIPLIFTGDARAFHQHHEVSDPPVEHLDAIIRNARIFHRKWGVWPMEGWLKAFETSGKLRFSPDRQEIFETPERAHSKSIS